jgi:hypothetical protein
VQADLRGLRAGICGVRASAGRVHNRDAREHDGCADGLRHRQRVAQPRGLDDCGEGDDEQLRDLVEADRVDHQ